MSNEIVKFDIELEQILLASAYHSKELMRILITTVQSSDYVYDDHKMIHLAFIASMKKKITKLDIDTIRILCKQQVEIKYLKELFKIKGTSEVVNFESMITDFKEQSLRIRLSNTEIARLNEMAIDGSCSAAELRKAALDVIDAFRLGEESSGMLYGQGAIDIYENLRKERKDGKRPFVGYGFSGLDDVLTEGQTPKSMITITARPSQGKTVFANATVVNNWRNGLKTLVLPLEPGHERCMDSLITTITGIPLNMLVKWPGKLTDKQNIKISRTTNALFKNDLITINDDVRTVQELDMALGRDNYQSVIIDLVELLFPNVEAAEITKQLNMLKSMANYHGVAMNMLNHINRENAKKKDKRPNIAMLKNSGTYEERSDIIFGLHREKFYDESLDDDILEIIVLKQRMGPVNQTFAYEFFGETLTIGNYIPEWVPIMGGKMNGGFK